MSFLFKKKDNNDEKYVLEYNQLKSIILSNNYSNIKNFTNNHMNYLKVYDLYECVLLYGNEYGLQVLFMEYGNEIYYDTVDMISILIQSVKNNKNIEMYKIIFRSFQKKVSYQNFINILTVCSSELLDLFIQNFTENESDNINIEFDVEFLLNYVIKENNINYIYKLFETFHTFQFLQKYVLDYVFGESINYNFINKIYLLNSIRDTLIDKCSETSFVHSNSSNNLII